MDTSRHCVRNAQRKRTRKAAFSLIEVTLAIGIVAFAFIGVFGLVPTGLNTFRQAIDTSVGSQITQRVFNEAQQTDFDVLLKNGVGAFWNKPVRYFDDQGNELSVAANATYQLNTRILAATSIPNGDTSSSHKITNANLATVTIQIVNNPGNRAIHSDSDTKLWNDPKFLISTYSGLVSRNQ